MASSAAPRPELQPNLEPAWPQAAGTTRGQRINSSRAAEISEMVTKLEGACPAYSTAEAASRLNGSWNLAYTANSELNGFLSLSALPGISVGAIVQEINSNAGTFINRISLSSPFASRDLSVSASFTLDSPKRLRLRFEQGAIDQPVFNTTISLSNLLQLDALRSLDRPLQQSAANLNSYLQGVSGLPLPVFPADTWLLNTYLDEDLRISRGDGGGLFILRRQTLLPSPSMATYL